MTKLYNRLTFSAIDEYIKTKSIFEIQFITNGSISCSISFLTPLTEMNASVVSSNSRSEEGKGINRAYHFNTISRPFNDQYITVVV